MAQGGMSGQSLMIRDDDVDEDRGQQNNGCSLDSRSSVGKCTAAAHARRKEERAVHEALGIQSKFPLCRNIQSLASSGFASLSKPKFSKLPTARCYGPKIPTEDSVVG